MIDFSKIRTLRDMVQTATDLSEPWNYFFDHLVDDPGFMALGKRVGKAPMLKATLESVGEEVFGGEAQLRRLELQSLRKHDLVHGACFINGCHSTVLFLPDVKMGLLAVSKPGNTQLVRFTEMGVAPAGEPGPVASLPPTRNTVN